MVHIKTCESCGTVWEIDEAEDEVIMMPWPHIRCPKCGHWIPLF